jgi:hypothetical protein
MTDAPDRLQEAWQDVDDKTLLIQILAELQTIRLAMTDEQPATDDSDPDGGIIVCDKCGTEVRERDRERHAREQHKCPPELTDTLYS